MHGWETLPVSCKLFIALYVEKDTNLDKERGLCTSAHSHPEWAASPTWSGQTCQPGNSRKPSRRAVWGLGGVAVVGRGLDKQKEKGDIMSEGDRSCIIYNYEASTSLEFGQNAFWFSLHLSWSLEKKCHLGVLSLWEKPFWIEGVLPTANKREAIFSLETHSFQITQDLGDDAVVLIASAASFF